MDLQNQILVLYFIRKRRREEKFHQPLPVNLWKITNKDGFLTGEKGESVYKSCLYMPSGRATQ